MSDIVQRLRDIDDQTAMKLSRAAANEIEKLRLANYQLSDCLTVATDKDLALKQQAVVDAARYVLQNVVRGETSWSAIAALEAAYDALDGEP